MTGGWVVFVEIKAGMAQKKPAQKNPKKARLKKHQKCFFLVFFGFFKNLSEERVKWTIFASFLPKQ